MVRKNSFSPCHKGKCIVKLNKINVSLEKIVIEPAFTY